jgi:RNA polymerase sigma-70 factor (ECF subfamily)
MSSHDSSTERGAAQSPDLGRQLIEHIPALRRYARVLARTADQADDLVQDCLERALSRSSLYQSNTNLRAWLFTILRNIAITQTRKEKLRRIYASERIAMERRVAAPSQTDMVTLKDSLRLLGSLSNGEQEAVTLLGLKDMSYDEAAGISGLPVGTMKSRLSRGRQRLRTLMDPQADDAAHQPIL